jgi:GH24 family phage-related lysozyme (muramidase)
MTISLLNVVKNYKGEPHQEKALRQFDEAAKGLAIVSDNAEWVKTWRTPPTLKPQPVIPKAKIPNQAISLIKEFEGFRADVYDDGVGVATIGYGTTVYPTGKRVQFGDRSVTEADAIVYLERDTESYWDVLVRTIPHWSEMSDNQRSALLSFAYNLGAYFYGGEGFATISRTLALKNWQSIPTALMLYVNPNSSVEAGLRRRRYEEGKLWRA